MVRQFSVSRGAAFLGGLISYKVDTTLHTMTQKGTAKYWGGFVSEGAESILLYIGGNAKWGEHPIHGAESTKLGYIEREPSWISKDIQSLMRERDRLFKFYCQETNPTVKLTKHNDHKRIRNIVVSKIK